MTEQHDSDEPLDIIEQEARAMAQCFGACTPDVAAASMMDRILLRLGGAHVYFPRQSSRTRQRVHQEIVRRFNGSNLFALAREFQISPRHVRRIIADSRNPDPSPTAQSRSS